MPSRVLRPQIVHSERWNRVTPMAQACFIRLLTLVDDFGRFELNPRLLSSLAYPFGDHLGRPVKAERVLELVGELEGADMLETYGNGTRYLELKRWTERKRSAAKYPGKADLPAVASNCQQMPADVVGCGQLPPPTPTPTPTTTPERERSGPVTDSGMPWGSAAGPEAAREWGILKSRLETLERELEGAEGDRRRELLGERKKTRAAFEAFSKAQAAAVAARVMGGLPQAAASANDRTERPALGENAKC